MGANPTALTLLQLAAPGQPGAVLSLPEPGAIILLLVGLGLLLFIRRRRRHHDKTK